MVTSRSNLIATRRGRECMPAGSLGYLVFSSECGNEGIELVRHFAVRSVPVVMPERPPRFYGVRPVDETDPWTAHFLERRAARLAAESAEVLDMSPEASPTLEPKFLRNPKMKAKNRVAPPGTPKFWRSEYLSASEKLQRLSAQYDSQGKYYMDSKVDKNVTYTVPKYASTPNLVDVGSTDSLDQFADELVEDLIEFDFDELDKNDNTTDDCKLLDKIDMARGMKKIRSSMSLDGVMDDENGEQILGIEYDNQEEERAHDQTGAKHGRPFADQFVISRDTPYLYMGLSNPTSPQPPDASPPPAYDDQQDEDVTTNMTQNMTQYGTRRKQKKGKKHSPSRVPFRNVTGVVHKARSMEAYYFVDYVDGKWSIIPKILRGPWKRRLKSTAPEEKPTHPDANISCVWVYDMPGEQWLVLPAARLPRSLVQSQTASILSKCYRRCTDAFRREKQAPKESFFN
ncbi:hypothetical protein GNI_102570 [Gregarina niphandrodes]|uniref:Uncharacterized protein n=1 Tax=Gregarina niphandrodes TaxID=110365 RepID=A0A023B4N8_GRENI|nr:hypothetical protein GNI_102570 [Gregarina niphandrodes]EZG56640.1 hypothetical protein GNI_102570 [Gregarina niphandrodes]|eukprot:XP_011131220.1 hypothetical protein GNI_102570 [Gregarina niphandrodes]